MEIQSITPINYGAKLLKKPKISKIYKNGNVDTEKVSFMEYSPSKKEANILDEAVRYWYEDKFGGDIAFDALLIADGEHNPKKNKVYILSTQTSHFDSLNPDKILGMAHVQTKGKKTVFINHLQTNPNLLPTPFGKKKDFEYKNIGKAIVKAIQQINSNRSVILESIYSAIGFYEKLDFEMIDPKYYRMKWKKKHV